MTTIDYDGICRCGHPLECHDLGECWIDLRTGLESWNPVEQCECRTADPA